MDQVPPFIPYSFKEPNEIWGRGSVDVKSCVAVQTIALLDIIKSKDASDPPSVALLFVVGEEKGGEGMKYFSAHKPTNYSAVLFGEPTESKLATGHKGMLSFTLDIKGRAAHSGYPWLGLSATNVLVEALGELRKLEDKLPRSPKLGETTVNVGRIEGGVAANVVAEHASAEVAVRIAAGTPKAVEDLIDGAFKHIKAKTEKDGGEFSVTYSDRAYGPVHLDTDLDGFKTIGVNYGTDVPNLDGDHKKYLYGPGSILVAHGPNEHLTTDDMEDAVVAYKKIITELLKRYE
jgi:acetylornithine deacetylase